MLPVLSNKLDTKLQLLVPVVVVPSALSTWRSALLELGKINAIRVRRGDKKQWFVVEVFAASSEMENEVWLQRPIARIERTLLEFARLRDEVYTIAREAHQGERCAFCEGFLGLIVYGANPGGLIVGMLGGKRLKRTIAAFVQELLRVTVRCTYSNTRGFCYGQTSIPQVVHTFFFSPPSLAA